MQSPFAARMNSSRRVPKPRNTARSLFRPLEDLSGRNPQHISQTPESFHRRCRSPLLKIRDERPGQSGSHRQLVFRKSACLPQLRKLGRQRFPQAFGPFIRTHDWECWVNWREYDGFDIQVMAWRIFCAFR